MVSGGNQDYTLKPRECGSLVRGSSPSDSHVKDAAVSRGNMAFRNPPEVA